MVVCLDEHPSGEGGADRAREVFLQAAGAFKLPLPRFWSHLPTSSATACIPCAGGGTCPGLGEIGAAMGRNLQGFNVPLSWR